MLVNVNQLNQLINVLTYKYQIMLVIKITQFEIN